MICYNYYSSTVNFNPDLSPKRRWPRGTSTSICLKWSSPSTPTVSLNKGNNDTEGSRAPPAHKVHGHILGKKGNWFLSPGDVRTCCPTVRPGLSRPVCHTASCTHHSTWEPSRREPQGPAATLEAVWREQREQEAPRGLSAGLSRSLLAPLSCSSESLRERAQGRIHRTPHAHGACRPLQHAHPAQPSQSGHYLPP